MSSIERRYAPLARHQHGLLTAEQLGALGLGRRGMQRRSADGRLELRHPGVYAVPGVPPSADQDLLAALLAAGPGAVASHRAAARLWGLGPEIWGPDPVVEITVPPPRHPRLAGVVVHRSTDLAPEHVARRRGIQVTTPTRLLVDLGAVVDASAVAQALEELVVGGLVEWRELTGVLEDVGRRGRRGCGVLRSVLQRPPVRATASASSRP